MAPEESLANRIIHWFSQQEIWVKRTFWIIFFISFFSFVIPINLILYQIAQAKKASVKLGRNEISFINYEERPNDTINKYRDKSINIGRDVMIQWGNVKTKAGGWTEIKFREQFLTDDIAISVSSIKEPNDYFSLHTRNIKKDGFEINYALTESDPIYTAARLLDSTEGSFNDSIIKKIRDKDEYIYEKTNSPNQFKELKKTFNGPGLEFSYFAIGRLDPIRSN